MPLFLGIGAQKAGTSWLWTHLVGHPDIDGDPTDTAAHAKERHFWCRSLHGDGGPVPSDPDAVGEYLDDLGAGGGEITPHYAVMPPRLVRAAADALGDTPILYVVREPAQRAWSQVAAMVQPKEPAHVRAWTETAAPLDADQTARARRLLERDGPRRHSDYVTNLERWRRHFERLTVVDQADIASAPREVLRRVYNAIGVDADHADTIPESALTARLNPHRPAPPVPSELLPILEERYGSLPYPVD